MLVCLASYGERLASLFDTASELLLYRVNERGIEQDRRLAAPGSASQTASLLASLGADVLLCGGMSCRCRELLSQTGIRVEPWLCGGNKEVLQAFAEDRLGSMVMPGCRRCYGRGGKKPSGQRRASTDARRRDR